MSTRLIGPLGKIASSDVCDSACCVWLSRDSRQPSQQFLQIPLHSLASSLSQASLNCKGRQDQDESIDDPPRKGYPCRHAKITSGVDTSYTATIELALETWKGIEGWHLNIHSSNHGPRNQGFDSSDEPKDNWCDPDQLPVPPLDHHRIHGGDEVDADHVDQRPQQDEAENRRSIV